MASDFNIPTSGEASDEIKKLAHETFIESANKRGIDLSGFNPAAPLIARIQWALQIGLIIACLYTRFSTKKQGSTADQVVRCVDYGAQVGMYVPPEFICCDEGIKGRKAERPGLDRIKAILKTGQVKAFLVYKLSRLARSSYRGVAFLREQVVGNRVRAISVTEAIDSANDKSWKLWSAIRGAMDEELLTAVGDHVRDSLIGLFNRGWTTGPVPAGYIPKPVPDLPKTRRGLPRTMPAIDEHGAPIILRAFKRVAEGMGISEAWRLYRAEGGPVDPRSTTGQMSYEAFRRMLARVEYTGLWQICKTKCEWSDSRDSMTQVPQSDESIQRRRIEELRIVPDELFTVVQSVLAKLERGPCGPRADRPKALWDLVTDVFFCASCRRRFYVGGAAGHAMRCPNPDCPAKGIVVRKDAVSTICSRLTHVLNADEDLVLSVIGRSQELDADAENRLRDVGRRGALGSKNEQEAERQKQSKRHRCSSRGPSGIRAISVRYHAPR